MLDKVLLRIAKSAILNQFDSLYMIEKEKLIHDFPYLSKSGAAFVTLHYDNNLRGCIGSVVAYQSLLDDIIANARSAAFRDPRFKAVSTHEFSHLKLEVSVLTEPILLEYTNYADLLTKIEPNIDGLILKYGPYQGTFLPQVWEELKSPEDFLLHLSAKAGTTPSIYEEHPSIYRYTVEAIEDNFDEILPL